MKHYRMLLMGIVAHLHRRVTAAAFAREGITRSQPWILDYLAENDGCIQRELADRSHFDPASITSALVGMEEQGLVRRESVKGDRRALKVYLTDLGREKQRYVQQVFTQTEARALEGFTQEEIDALEDYLQRIHQNLEKDGER
jgi:DNA-binding MarR family transcriptional regulator